MLKYIIGILFAYIIFILPFVIHDFFKKKEKWEDMFKEACEKLRDVLIEELTFFYTDIIGINGRVTIFGQFHKVSVKYLPQYIDEFCFLFN